MDLRNWKSSTLCDGFLLLKTPCKKTTKRNKEELRNNKNLGKEEKMEAKHDLTSLDTILNIIFHT